MVSFPIRQVFERSVDKLKRDASKALKMDLGIHNPPITLYSFDSSNQPIEKPNFLARGSDADIGGYSTNTLTPVFASTSTTPPPAKNTPSADTIDGTAGPSQSHIAFHGHMSLKVPQEFAGRIRTGYAGVRNRKRITLFGEDTWDLSAHSHLRLTLAYRGWEGWRNRWYCNIQTDGPILTDLFQHRIEFPRSRASRASTSPLDPHSGPPPQFTTFHLPLSSFVLTNSGHTADHQMEMMYSKIRTVGFSLLGGGRGEEGLPAVSNTLSQAQIAEMRRRAGAGFGKGGGAEDPDPIVEEMLAQDGVSVKGTQARVDPVKAAGYHRVTSSPILDEVREEVQEEVGSGASTFSSRASLRSGEVDGVKVTPWSEGYYELCIKSVEAVSFDPLAEEEGPESRDM